MHFTAFETEGAREKLQKQERCVSKFQKERRGAQRSPHHTLMLQHRINNIFQNTSEVTKINEEY